MVFWYKKTEAQPCSKITDLLVGDVQSRANSSLEDWAGNSSSVLGSVPCAPNSAVFPTRWHDDSYHNLKRLRWEPHDAGSFCSSQSPSTIREDQWPAYIPAKKSCYRSHGWLQGKITNSALGCRFVPTQLLLCLSMWPDCTEVTSKKWWSVHSCTFTLNHGMLLFLFSKLFPTNTFDFCQRWKSRAALWALYMFVMSLKICVSSAAACSLLAYGKWDATVNQKISLKHEKNLQTAYTSHRSDLKPASWERDMFKSARIKTANT